MFEPVMDFWSHEGWGTAEYLFLFIVWEESTEAEIYKLCYSCIIYKDVFWLYIAMSYRFTVAVGDSLNYLAKYLLCIFLIDSM